MNRWRSRRSLAAGILAMSFFCAMQLAAQAQDEQTDDDLVSDQSLSDLGRIDHLLHDGRYPDAEDVARQGLIHLEALGQGMTVSASLYADRLVESLLLGGKGTRQESLDRARLAVAVRESELGAEDTETAQSLERLGRVLTRRTEFTEAANVLDQALAVAESSGGKESVQAAGVQLSIGELLLDQGQFDQARAVIEQALATLEKLLGPDSLEIAESLRLLGALLTKQHQVQPAIDALERSQQICLRTLGAEHPRLASTLTALGDALKQKDENGLAQAHLERAIAIFQDSNGPESPLLVAPLNSLAGVFLISGNLGESRKLRERALEIAVREFGPDDPVAVETLRGLAILRATLGDFLAAEEIFADVARRLEARYGRSHWEVARAIENQGVALAQADDFSKAEQLLLKALEIFNEVLGPDNPRVAQTHLNLVPTYEGLGELSKAQQHGLRALEILDNAGNPSPSTRGKLLANLGHITRRMGDLDGALSLAEQAESALRQAYGPFHPDVAKQMQNRAGLMYSSGQYEQARDLALESEANGREHLASVLRSTTEREALMFASERFSSVDFQIFMALNHPEDRYRIVPAAWDSVIRARAMVLDEMTLRRRVRPVTMSTEEAQFERELELATERLAKLVIKGPDAQELEVFNATVSEARAAKARAERAYAERSEKFRQTLESNGAGFSQVAASLPPGSQLVAFKLFEYWPHAEPGSVDVEIIGEPTSEYAAFVLSSAADQPILVRLGKSEEIDNLIMTWHRSVTGEALNAGLDSRSGEAGYRKVAEDLRRVVWDPISRHLAGAGNLLIVPDGALNLVDFSALPVGEVQYLAETGPRLQYLSSERDLLLGDPPEGVYALLAIGSPDFDSTEQYAALRKEPMQLAMNTTAAAGHIYRGPRSSCGSFQTMTFEPLPASFKEASEIRELWLKSSTHEDDATLLSGSSASETAFKAQARDKRVLHLATHGFFLGGDCGSALSPLQGDNVTNENPLLLSGLVLAGANNRTAAGPDEDDGILTAEEIAALDLANTEWAVLSACDTGRGEFRAGEGVFGLQRAFRIAGVRTTIMSLWPVEDDITRRWMAALYRHHFAEGLSTMESVHFANLELLLRRRTEGLSTHPFYWAGFIASGDWR